MRFDGLKACGACTLCCKLLDVIELRKPAGRRCRHVRAEGGCTIYAERPASCARFECAWLTSPGLSDDLKPDRCGVVLAAAAPDEMTMLCEPQRFEDVWHVPALRALGMLALAAGRRVIVSDGVRVRLVSRHGEQWQMHEMVAVSADPATGQKQLAFGRLLASGALALAS